MNDVAPNLPTPRVSVIVPVYNTAERLFGTLEALRTQDLKDAEFILVDDGSTDSSLEICRRFADRDPRFRVLTGPNGGVCVARNRGLDVARGEWLAFCDSDDRVRPDIYTTLLGLAEREKADLPSGALCDIGPDETRSGIVDFPIVGDEDTIRGARNVLVRGFYPLLNDTRTVHGYLVICLFRRSLVEARHIRFCPGVTMCEDELFMLDYLLSAQAIAVVRKDVYDYVRFSASACSVYYGSLGDFKREFNWYRRARERQRIFMDGGLGRTDVATARRLAFQTHYHEAQAFCCNPALSWREKVTKALALRRHVLDLHSTPAGLSAKAFHGFLVFLPFLLPNLLWAKRRGADLARKLHHALRQKQHA